MGSIAAQYAGCSNTWATISSWHAISSHFQDFLKKNKNSSSCDNKGKRYVFEFLICRQKVFNFRFVVLCGYCDSDDDPHHISDVFLHGESISDRITGDGELFRSILTAFVSPLQILTFDNVMSL